MFAQSSRFARLAIAALVISSFVFVKHQLKGGKGQMNIFSSAFQHGSSIPAHYTCDGADISPPLSWDEGPEGTVSYVLICDDPDAPRQDPWVHWVMYNIPADVTSLSENLDKVAKLPNGSIQAMNDFGRVGYGGPCPPPGHGQHRYYFKIYALNTMLSLPSSATKADVAAISDKHLVAEGVLMGTYERK